MATQRVTIAKVGGDAANLIADKLRGWAAARTSDSQSDWSGEQWPASVRDKIDEFAEQIRSHSTAPPVIYFAEWMDWWSMFIDFERWLTPPDGPMPTILLANRYQVYGYVIPDRDRLKNHLRGAGKQQWPESDWYVRRLREAVSTWERLVDGAVLIVLRLALDVAASDDEVRASLSRVPDWLSG